MKKKYVQVGLGGRARFMRQLHSSHHQTCELVGFVMYLKQGWISKSDACEQVWTEKVKTCMPSEF